MKKQTNISIKTSISVMTAKKKREKKVMEEKRPSLPKVVTVRKHPRIPGVTLNRLRFLFWSARFSCSPELLRCPRNFLWYGGPVQLVTLPGLSLVLQNLVGARWSSSRHKTWVFLFLNALFVLASASSRRFGYSMLCLSVALFPGAEVGCP